MLGSLLIFVSPNSAVADNHIVRMNEVMAGLNGDSSIQFVEMVASDDSQKRWGPQSGETVGRARLVFSDAAGNQTGRFVFPSNPPVERIPF